MAAIARFGELGKCPGEIRVVLPLDRFAEIRERRPALVLDQPCERNALVRGIELRRRGKTLLNLAELVVGERPVTDFAGIGQLEMSPLGHAHDVCKTWDGAGGVSRLLSLRSAPWPIGERRRCHRPGEKTDSDKALHVPTRVSDESVGISNPLFKARSS